MEDNSTQTPQEDLTIEGLKESLGIPVSESTPTDASNGQEPPKEPAEPPKIDPASQEPAPSPQELPLETIDRQAHQFAQMRKQIADQNKILSELGNSLGVKGKPEEIIAGLTKLTQVQTAKEKGIPPEIQMRLERLEAEKTERDANERKIQTYAQIQSFQNELKLDKTEMETFLIGLAKSGKNPFEADINLKSEYLVANFEKLQAKAVQEALEAEAKRVSKAQQHSTNPGTKTGGGESAGDKITTLDGLDAFLKANLSK